MTPPLRRAAGRLASRQHGVVTREELLGIGWTDEMIESALATGVLRRLFPGVHQLLGAADTWQSRAVAAQRRVERQLRRKRPRDAATPVVALAGAAAAHLHGLPWFPRPTGLVVATSHRSRSRFVATVTRPDLRSSDVVDVDDVPTVTLDWTVLEVAAVRDATRVADVVAHVLRTGLLPPDRLFATTARAPGHPGAAVVRELARSLSGRHRSNAERRLADACERIGMDRPQANRSVATSSGTTYELDLSWSDVRLDVEVDGPHHLLPEQRSRDRRRDFHLREDGWEPVRILVEDVDEDVDEVARRIRRVHALLPGRPVPTSGVPPR